MANRDSCQEVLTCKLHSQWSQKWGQFLRRRCPRWPRSRRQFWRWSIRNSWCNGESFWFWNRFLSSFLCRWISRTADAWSLHNSAANFGGHEWSVSTILGQRHSWRKAKTLKTLVYLQKWYCCHFTKFLNTTFVIVGNLENWKISEIREIQNVKLRKIWQKDRKLYL